MSPEEIVIMVLGLISIPAVSAAVGAFAGIIAKWVLGVGWRAVRRSRVTYSQRAQSIIALLDAPEVPETDKHEASLFTPDFHDNTLYRGYLMVCPSGRHDSVRDIKIDGVSVWAKLTRHERRVILAKAAGVLAKLQQAESDKADACEFAKLELQRKPQLPMQSQSPAADALDHSVEVLNAAAAPEQATSAGWHECPPHYPCTPQTPQAVPAKRVLSGPVQVGAVKPTCTVVRPITGRKIG